MTVALVAAVVWGAQDVWTISPALAAYCPALTRFMGCFDPPARDSVSVRATSGNHAARRTIVERTRAACLNFRHRQATNGTVDVAEDHARLEVMLPWPLAQIADKIQRAIQSQGKTMLEKK
jgi:hypothetical protein